VEAIEPTHLPFTTPIATPEADFDATPQAVAGHIATRYPTPGEGWRHYEATMMTLGLWASPTPDMLALPTPFPFPIKTVVNPTLGVVGYQFEGTSQIADLQLIYERYWDFISFRQGPPPDDVDVVLAQHIAPSARSRGGGNLECTYEDVLQSIASLRRRGDYLRLTLPRGIRWSQENSKRFLDVSDKIVVSLQTAFISDLQVELVEIRTGRVIVAMTIALAPEPHFEYDSAALQWRLMLDRHGFYCEGMWWLEDTGF
jgi:hypothetical protein